MFFLRKYFFHGGFETNRQTYLSIRDLGHIQLLCDVPGSYISKEIFRKNPRDDDEATRLQ